MQIAGSPYMFPLNAAQPLSLMATLVAVSTFATGCATHHQRPATHAELAAADRIVLTNGHSVDIKTARYGPNDSIEATESGGESRYQRVDIKEVEIVNHGRGMLHGLGTGFLAGAVFGGVVGYVGGDDPPCEDDPILGMLLCTRSDAKDKAIAVGALLGIILAIPGAAIGHSIGSSDIYHHKAPQLDVDIKPTDGGGEFSLRYRF